MPPASRNSTTSTPQAPKGGAAWQIALGTYDSFNTVVAGIKGTPARGIEQIYDTLFVAALDEPTSTYGLIAEAVSYPDDFSKATFRLRPEAKWHDGKPVTPDDVIFSYESFKKLSPQYAANFRHVSKAEKTGEHEVTFTFAADRPSRPAASSSASSPCCRSIGGRAPARTARSAASAKPRSSRRSAAGPTASRNSPPATTWSTSG